jgi:GT2 family glycosyltransferase
MLSTEGVKVLRYNQRFNFSKIINYAAAHTNADILCFLNNDVQVLSYDWLENMVHHVQQPKIGVVGSCLTYPDGKIQHVGISLGSRGVAEHPYAREPLRNLPTEKCFEVSAVTFACALVTAETFRSVGGLDTRMAVGLNDVDFGYRLKELGYKNFVCMNSQLIHLESQSRKKMINPVGAARAVAEVLLFLSKHKGFRYEDPYFMKKV